jgi:hypothetical protein
MNDGTIPPILSALGAPPATLHAAILDRNRQASRPRHQPADPAGENPADPGCPRTQNVRSAHRKREIPADQDGARSAGRRVFSRTCSITERAEPEAGGGVSALAGWFFSLVLPRGVGPAGSGHRPRARGAGPTRRMPGHAY